MRRAAAVGCHLFVGHDAADWHRQIERHGVARLPRSLGDHGVAVGTGGGVGRLAVDLQSRFLARRLVQIGVEIAGDYLVAGPAGDADS